MNCRQLLKEGELASLMDEPPNWLMQNDQPRKTVYTNNKNRFSRLDLYICTSLSVYLYVATIIKENETILLRRGHDRG